LISFRILPITLIIRGFYAAADNPPKNETEAPIAAIVYWNSTYVSDAVDHLRAIGEAVDDALLRHTSPVGWEHIGLSGNFLWDRAAKLSHRKALILPPKWRATG